MNLSHETIDAIGPICALDPNAGSIWHTKACLDCALEIEGKSTKGKMLPGKTFQQVTIICPNILNCNHKRMGRKIFYRAIPRNKRNADQAENNSQPFFQIRKETRGTTMQLPNDQMEEIIDAAIQAGDPEVGINLYRQAMEKQKKKLHAMDGIMAGFTAKGERIKVEISLPNRPERIATLAFMSSVVTFYGQQKTINEQIGEKAPETPSDGSDDQPDLFTEEEGEEPTGDEEPNDEYESLFIGLDANQVISLQADEGLELGGFQYPKDTPFEVVQIDRDNEVCQISEWINPADDDAQLVGDGNPIDVSADLIDEAFSE